MIHELPFSFLCYKTAFLCTFSNDSIFSISKLSKTCNIFHFSERKKPGQNSTKERASPAVDRVEITKIPVSSNLASPLASTSMSFKSSTPKAGAEGDSPLNLSTKTPFMSPMMDSLSNKSLSGSAKIPQEYYACKCGLNLTILFCLQTAMNVI